MKVIHADHERRYEVPGAPGPARRPVEVDASMTGFQRLRSLRVYRFSPGTPVEGHAEEDEVFLIVTTGSAEIQIGLDEKQPDSVGTFTLSAFSSPGANPSVAYLPPQSVYKLIPHTEVDVAYARATPTDDLQARVFAIQPNHSTTGHGTLLSEQSHAQHLRLKLSYYNANQNPTEVDLREGTPATGESLVHLRSAPDGSLGTVAGDGTDNTPVASWDTVVLAPSEVATLRMNPGIALAVLTVSAE